MGKFKKKKSKKCKRSICRKSCKMSREFAELKHSFRHAQKKYSELRGPQDPEVSNCLPLKDEISRATKLRKQRAEDLREAQNDCRLKLQMGNRNIEDLVEEATQKVRDFKIFNDHESQEQAESSSVKCKLFYEDFKKVVESADVILEVLDARDPVGTRCPQVEQLVINKGLLLVLVLNKIDLIPKNNVNEWLKYLRQECLTVSFKASIPTLDHTSDSRANAVYITESVRSSRCCIGPSLLMKLLRNYCRTQNIQTVIKVGVVGFPNVGKKRVISSLKHFYSCTGGVIPNITNAVQELSLNNKHIEILDEPGVVYAKDGSSVTLALRNAVKVEDLKDVISPAEAIFERTDHAQLCFHYCLPQFSSCHEFLSCMAAKMCKFKIGGIPDSEAGARRLINDWNSGKIKYYTHPPEKFIKSLYINTEYMAAINEELYLEEKLELNNALFLFPAVSVVAKSTGPTEGVVDGKLEVIDNALFKVPVEFNTNEENRESDGDLNNLCTEYQLHKLWKKKCKKKEKKQKKKFHKLALSLTESIETSLTLD